MKNCLTSDQSPSIQSTWQDFETWITNDSRSVDQFLAPPATEDQIVQLEQTIGLALPIDVRNSYLIHNGQVCNPRLLFHEEFLSLEEIEHEWKTWKELLDGGEFDGITSEPDDEFVRNDWWNPAWIPITADGAGNHYCLDLAPTAKGTVGQIIEFNHDATNRGRVAPCLAAWLEMFILEWGDFDDYLEAEEN